MTKRRIGGRVTGAQYDALRDRVKLLESTLGDLLDACVDWSAGMEEIGEFIQAEVVLGRREAETETE